MYNYDPEQSDTYADGYQTAARYFYGSKHRDQFLLHDPKGLCRFGHLARKVLMHYAGEHYNPHTICLTQEYFIRTLIKSTIEYRITHKTPGYDWEWLDHFFRKVVSDYYKIDLPYSRKRIKQGLQPPFKGKLHDVNTALPI